MLFRSVPCRPGGCSGWRYRTGSGTVHPAARGCQAPGRSRPDKSGTKNELYLRPETAQGIFVNFQNIQRTTRKKVPFGVGQIGKSFRNEITPGNFIFRVREFEQMELEFFCKPGTDLEWFQYWRTYCHDWLMGLNVKDENLRLRDHSPEELCFYSKATTDFEFLFPFGWGELWGHAPEAPEYLRHACCPVLLQ